MSDDLIKVYEGVNLPEAELVHQALTDQGIDAFVDPTASPLDGLTAMAQGTPVMVRQDDVPQAQQIIAEFLEQQTHKRHP
ncbi:MAG: putative signal transducing protein [Planctomycetota bacterium]